MLRSLRVLYASTVFALTYLGNSSTKSFMHKCIFLRVLFGGHEKARAWRVLLTCTSQSVINEYLPLTESL